eukprot:TRINITY_DN1479_c0_g1_i1.p2 TRINITY_DN1479_c0_g1~~TRINITY_DN1479_c0_g1_i1.p2  ORF type:complete len:458 (-),score=31.70 TRINITY_DN1479_c0_g1_i1:2015-3388(-)
MVNTIHSKSMSVVSHCLLVLMICKVVSSRSLSVSMDAEARAPQVSTVAEIEDTDIPIECTDEASQLEVIPEVGGSFKVSSSRFPYMVSLQRKSQEGDFSHFCGGTLLSNSLILTAAHCVFSQYEDVVLYDFRVDNSVYNGNIALSAELYATRAPRCRHLANNERIRIARHYIHPDYNGDANVGGDIAILELEAPFDYNGPYVEVWPIKPNTPDWGVNVVLGWGVTNIDEAYDSDLFLNSYEQLRMGMLMYMDTDTCQQEVGSFDPYLGRLVDERVICFYNRGVDSCGADSGGPLLQLGPRFIDDEPQNDVQLGIVSWGPDRTCTGQDGLPGLYTNIAIYASWVQTIVGQYSTPSPQCSGKLSVFSEPQGDVLLSGYNNLQSSAKNCCESCSGLPGCNAWVYCYYNNGCKSADGSTVPKGFCQLKQFEGQVKLNTTMGITVWGGYQESEQDIVQETQT